MAEVFRSFDEPVRDASGAYSARVVGRLAADGMWEGWLEFVPADGRVVEALASPIESRQPERGHLSYWADLTTFTDAQLVSFVVAAVEARLTRRGQLRT